MNDLEYLKIYYDLEIESIELLYDINEDKVWIDKKSLITLSKMNNITLSRLISKITMNNLINPKDNIKPYKKKNYKTTFIYDNKVIKTVLKNDQLYEDLLKCEINNINIFKKKMLGKIYLKDGLLFLNDCLINEKNIFFTKNDIIKFLDLENDYYLDDEVYSLEDLFDFTLKINNDKSLEFKNWAYQVLSKCLVDGYYINNEKCFNNKKKIISITNIADNLLNNKCLDNEDKYLYYKSVIKHNDILYDSKLFIDDLIKHAKEKIIIISKYLNDKIFDLLNNSNVKIIIYTSKITSISPIVLEKFSNKHDITFIDAYTHDKTYIIIDTAIYNFDISITNLFKENSTCKTINIKYSDFINSII